MRTPLIVGALVVLAAAVVLFFAVVKPGEEPKVAPTEPAGQTGETAAKPVPPPARPQSVTVTDRPRGESAPTPMTGGEYPREYAVGDTPIRDHRAGDNKPIDIPPNIHPNDSRLIPSALTHDISQKVKAARKDCVKDLPEEGRGEKPRMEGQILIAIKDKTLSVTQATIQLRDLDGLGATAEAAKQCVEAHAVGLSTIAPDEADLESYSINLSFMVP
jgi:hypothetical protein